jgi:hypothetical protein
MKTLDIYLDFLFLRYFLDNEPSDKYSDDYQDWFDFVKFLEKHNHIKIITPNRNKENKRNDFIIQFRQLLRDKSYRREFFEYFPKQVAKYKISTDFYYENEIQNPHSVFFIEFPTQDSEILEKKYGYFFINSQNFKTKWKLLNPRTYQSFKIVSEKGTLNNWESFKIIKHPVNAVLIDDRYVFAGDYQHNLQELLTNLFEKNETKSEILVVIGNAINNKETNIGEETELLKETKKIVKRLFANSNFSIAQLIENSNQKRTEIKLTHDRRVISNYFYLVSGDSYSYDKTFVDKITGEKKIELNTNTDFHIYTVFDSETFANIQNRLLEFRKLILKQDNSPKLHIKNREGDCQNHLLL